MKKDNIMRRGFNLIIKKWGFVGLKFGRVSCSVNVVKSGI